MFLFRLAGFLKKTVAELCRDMDSREYSEWIAVHRYYHPLPDEWQQVGLVASATLAPYCRRGSTPKPHDFVPTATPPQHEMQIRDAVERLSRDLEAG